MLRPTGDGEEEPWRAVRLGVSVQRGGEEPRPSKQFRDCISSSATATTGPDRFREQRIADRARGPIAPPQPSSLMPPAMRPAGPCGLVHQQRAPCSSMAQCRRLESSRDAGPRAGLQHLTAHHKTAHDDHWAQLLPGLSSPYDAPARLPPPRSCHSLPIDGSRNPRVHGK